MLNKSIASAAQEHSWRKSDVIYALPNPFNVITMLPKTVSWHSAFIANIKGQLIKVSVKAH